MYRTYAIDAIGEFFICFKDLVAYTTTRSCDRAYRDSQILKRKLEKNYLEINNEVVIKLKTYEIDRVNFRQGSYAFTTIVRCGVRSGRVDTVNNCKYNPNYTSAIGWVL
jgi:hypothetical protein